MPNPQSSFSLTSSRKTSDHDPGDIGLPVELRTTTADKARGSPDSDWCLNGISGQYSSRQATAGEKQ